MVTPAQELELLQKRRRIAALHLDVCREKLDAAETAEERERAHASFVKALGAYNQVGHEAGTRYQLERLTSSTCANW